MAIPQTRSKRKVTGGRYIAARGKRRYELGRSPTLTRVEKKEMKTIRGLGGNLKQSLLRTNIANLFDPKTKKYTQVEIKNVADNPANRNFIRRNILTKGTIIETEKGNAKITSRPGQEGTVNAVLV